MSTTRVVFEPIQGGWLVHHTHQVQDHHLQTDTSFGTVEKLVGDVFQIRGEAVAEARVRELTLRNEELDFFPFKAFFWGFLIGLGIGLFSMWVHFS